MHFHKCAGVSVLEGKHYLPFGIETGARYRAFSSNQSGPFCFNKRAKRVLEGRDIEAGNESAPATPALLCKCFASLLCKAHGAEKQIAEDFYLLSLSSLNACFGPSKFRRFERNIGRVTLNSVFKARTKTFPGDYPNSVHFFLCQSSIVFLLQLACQTLGVLEFIYTF